MKTALRPGAMILALGLFLAIAVPALAEGELVLTDASLSGKTVTATVTNSTLNLVSGQVIGTYLVNGKTQEVAVKVKLAGGASAQVSLTFKGPTPLGITEGPDPIPQRYIELRTITDDINPY